MSALAWFLAFLFAVSCICLVSAGWAAHSAKPDSAKWFKVIVTIYALVIACSLVSMIHHFIGWGSETSSVPKSLQRRLGHAGYYFSRDGELRLLGQSEPLPKRINDPSSPLVDQEEREQEDNIIRQLLPTDFSESAEERDSDVIEHGFAQRSLAAGELLTLKPVWNGQKASEWDLTYAIKSRPLRLLTTKDGETESRLVNVPPDWWISDGDTLVISRESGNEIKFVAIKWVSGTKFWMPFTQKTNAYYFSHGTLNGQVEVYDKGPLLMSERILNDGITLDSLIRLGRKDFLSEIGTIGEEWWSLFQNIALAREQRGNAESRIGLLIANDVFTTSGVRVYKRSADGITHSLTNSSLQTTTERIPTTTIVSYGFVGRRNWFDLKLTEEVFPDEVWGQVMRVELVHPNKWALPPEPNKDFIVTSTADYIPLDGYVIDIGGSSHTFYAKAHLGNDLDDLYINDGRNLVKDENNVAGPRRFVIDEPASLGDYEQGVLFKLMRSQSEERSHPSLNSVFGSLRHTGRASILLIILNALTFVVLLIKQQKSSLRPKIFLGWSLIWAIILALLTVRLVLAYRVSLIPPLDSNFSEIRGVFDKGVDYALVGLLLFAAITLSLSLAPHRSQRANWKTSSITIVLAGWALVIGFYTAIGTLISGNQSLGIRINIANHLLILLGLALITKPVLESGSRLLKGLVASIVLLAIASQVLFVKDAGAIIYLCSLLLPIFLIVGWDSQKGFLRNQVAAFIKKRRWPRRATRRLSQLLPARVTGGLLSLVQWLIPILIAVSPIILLLLSPLLADRGIRKVVEPALPDTAFYRFASFTDTEDAILSAKSGQDDVDMSKLLNNSQQNWQMLLYASEGAMKQAGYGRAPLSNVGMTYATSVSDCAFATYVLAEHGKWAGLFLLLLYILLACTCVIVALHLDDTNRSRNIVLIAVGGFFLYNAVYMAGANVGLFPFTGQNLPLLGLNSGGDLAQGLVVAFLAGWLLLRTTQSVSPGLLLSNRPVLLRTSLGMCIGAILLLGLVMLRIMNVGKEPLYRQDHVLKQETLDRMIKDLPADDPATVGQPLVLNGEKLDLARGAQLMEIEDQYRKQFNDRSDKFNPNGGIYYLERGRDTSGRRKLRLKVNQRYIYARSPFSIPRLWHGDIVAGDENEPTLYGLSKKKVMISLNRQGYPGSVNLSEARPTRTIFSPLLFEGSREFCELTRRGDRLMLDPKLGNWAIFVDGKRIPVGEAVEVPPLSLVVIERREVNYRRNLIYLGSIRPVLAYVRWRNGERRRMFPESSISLPYLIGKAADSVNSAQMDLPVAEQRLKNQLALTLDVELQQKLQSYITRYAGTHANYSPFRENPNRLAVTVLDAFNGDVLALASWPMLDPSKADYEKLVDKIPEPSRSRFEDNGNLTKHVVGSTIKPVVVASMAFALWPGRDLASLRFYNRPTGSPRNAEQPVKHPHVQVGGLNIDLWDCNSKQPESDLRNFIVHSLDYPEGVLGMLGMIRTTQEINSVLTREPRARADISFNGTDYSVDLMRASEDGTAFSTQDQREGRLPSTRGGEVVNDTLLFRALTSVFDFKSSGLPEARLGHATENFFPTLYNPKLSLSRNEYLDNVIPTRLDMSVGSFQGVRQGFLSCVLGGEPCGFNNVMMAEAAARLASGQRIFARLEDSVTSPPSNLSPPLDNQSQSAGHQDSWRVENIIGPMELVGSVGTASAFSDPREAPLNLPPQYRALFKTGTIVEGDEGRESETLMFVVGRWTNGSFVPGETVVGFLYMEKSKVKDPQLPDGNMKKFVFAAPLLRRIIEHVRTAY